MTEKLRYEIEWHTDPDFFESMTRNEGLEFESIRLSHKPYTLIVLATMADANRYRRIFGEKVTLSL